MLIREFAAPVLALFLAAVVAAADETKAPDPPKSPPAVAAIHEYEKSVHDADEAFRHARLLAETKLVQKLKIALTAATKAGSLPEANAIDAQITAANARITDLTANKAQPEGKTFVVAANKAWQPTVKVSAGQWLKITAHGKWCSNINARAATTSGPDGKGDRGWLEGKIGDGQVIRIGSQAEFTVENDGDLLLEMADSVRDDNDGSMTVVIVILPSKP
ncbi:MAG: hypothetical protein JWL69_2203 [Phycisphaerales bacterium]|nr:hypothetical protein [Phycisphaerales bacterium]MDB5354892.1 hypothetical protein [Phycisphaerales bacterium]